MTDQEESPIQAEWDTGSPERTHFDPLLDSLVVVTKLYDKPTTATALSAGLPLVDNKLTTTLLPRAAERAGLAARLLNRELNEIVPEVLPAILLLHNGQACVITHIDHAQNKATIIRPEAGLGEVSLHLDGLNELYSGFCFFIKREYQFDKERRLVTGEAGKHWFWDTLLDADQANNTAGWQWVAGCGADAAPYFRIFNPITQSEKFDPNGDYIRQYVPELAGLSKKYIHTPWLAPTVILKDANIIKIDNNINTKDFKKLDQEKAKSILKISTKKQIILYGAQNPQSPRKGWKIFRFPGQAKHRYRQQPPT